MGGAGGTRACGGQARKTGASMIGWWLSGLGARSFLRSFLNEGMLMLTMICHHPYGDTETHSLLSQVEPVLNLCPSVPCHLTWVWM